MKKSKSLKTFEVTVIREYVEELLIEAETADEAKQKAIDGDCLECNLHPKGVVFLQNVVEVED